MSRMFCTFTEAVGCFSIYEIREEAVIEVVDRVLEREKLRVALASVCLSSLLS